MLTNPTRILAGIITPLVACALSCSSVNEPNTSLFTSLGMPEVTGLVITSHDPTPLAIWRNPGSSSPPGELFKTTPEILPERYAFLQPYPNPFTDTLHIGIDLPQTTKASAWVTGARWAGDGITDASLFAGGSLNTPRSSPVRTFFLNQVLDAGHLRVAWDQRDDEGKPVAPGFYRVFFRAMSNGRTLFMSWRDVLLYKSQDELPSDLKALVIWRDHLSYDTSHP